MTKNNLKVVKTAKDKDLENKEKNSTDSPFKKLSELRFR